MDISSIYRKYGTRKQANFEAQAVGLRAEIEERRDLPEAQRRTLVPSLPPNPELEEAKARIWP